VRVGAYALKEQGWKQKDILYALGGRDNLLGGEGKDWVLGGNQRRASGGDKALAGGPGNDGHWGGIGSETVLGGSGDDFVHGENGFDRLIADRKDMVADDCERVLIVHGTEAEVMKQEEAFIDSLPQAELEFWGTFFERLAPDPTAGG
jgi:Ca2+-binding RTX toxin-like protein